MKTMTELANSTPINEDLVLYDDVIQKLQEAKENNVAIEEGIFGAIFGGIEILNSRRKSHEKIESGTPL